MSRRLVTILGVLAGLLVVPASAASAVPAPIGTTTRASVAAGGIQATGESRGVPAISGNGRYVVFSSAASNLVAGDTNGKQDVFIRDRVTGATTRVSVAPGGTAANDASDTPKVSADGRYVVFSSAASNLVVGDTNGMSDVFVRDRVAGITTRVSLAADDAQANDGSFPAGISADGRVVAFISEASNLVAGDTNGCAPVEGMDPCGHDLFVRDRVTGTTTRVSVATGGTQARGTTYGAGMSADGRYLVFSSDAPNLVAGETNVHAGVLVHDRVTGVTTRVSVANGGAKANNSSLGYLAISANGRYVVFASDASNLVASDTNGMPDQFVRDRVARTTTRVSVATDGTQANGSTSGASMSADGRYVAFESWASNLVAGDTNGQSDVFVRDRVALSTTRVSVATGGTLANRSSDLPAISADGRYVAFNSWASNLVAGDTNGKVDVFVRDRFAPATPVSDFNRDGWSDLVARQTSTGSLYLHKGNGTAFTGSVRIGTGWNAMNVITRFGDFNRDGREDVIARESATGALWLYRGTGTGFLARLKIGGGWSGMSEITPVGDLTGDRYPDLLAVQTSTGYLYVFPGRGTSLGAGRRIGGGWKAMSELAGVGDVNRDGRLDLVARKTATGALWLYRGNGTGVGSGVQVGTGWSGMRDLVGVGDFDRDGLADLAAVQSATGKLLRYPWRGTSFGSAVLLGSGWTTDLRPLL